MLITKPVMKMINVLTRFCVLYVVKCVHPWMCTRSGAVHFELSDLRGSFVNMRNLEQLLNGFIIKTLRFYKVVNHYSHFVTYSQASKSKHPSFHFFGCTLIDFSSLHFLKRPLFLRKYISLCVFESFASFITQYPQCTLK